MLTILQGLAELFYVWIKSLILFWTPYQLRHKKNIEKEIVLITGGGNGLGRLLAVSLSRLGAKIVIWDVDAVGAQETCKQIENFSTNSVFFYTCNVADKNEVRLVASKVQKEVGQITLLINNAGILIGKYFPDLTETEIEQVFRVNTFAHFWTCKAFLPNMMASNHGHIVTIASAAGLGGSLKLSDYCASKHAVVGFEESLRIELEVGGYDGVKTTLVCPSFFRSGLHQGLRKTFAEVSMESVAEGVVKGILTNERIVLVPGSLSLFVIFKALWPTAVYMKVLELMNTTRVLEHYRGVRYLNVIEGAND